MFVLERVLGQRQPVGAPAHRGTAVEHGVTIGLLDPAASIEVCVAEALARYDTLTALSGDARREDTRDGIPAMVEAALAELRPYGVPTRTQGYVEWRPEGLAVPIIGYFDFEWAQHGVIVDLKTTERLPPSIKVDHARQVSLYCTSSNSGGVLTYVTPKKVASYNLENTQEHIKALHRIALTVERFLSLSDDPQELASLVCPDLTSFYWAPDRARRAAFEQWGI